MDATKLEQILTALLDTLVPGDEDRRLPGAGALGLAAVIAEKIGGIHAIATGLAAVDEHARATLDAGFDDLPLADRVTALTGYSETDPGLVPGLIFHTYGSYYAHPAVLDALGMEGRPPHPIGYTMAPLEESLLDTVKRRPPFFRAT